MKERSSRLLKVLDHTLGPSVPGVVTYIESEDGSFRWSGAAGNLRASDPYFIASTTKLYTTALVLGLRDEGRLNLEDPLGKFLPAELISGIHLMRGEDRSAGITIGQLLAHTSGLPDYFQYKQWGGRSLLDEIVDGKDQAWSAEDVVRRVKTMRPRFAPGTPGKALYSDTNYQLLGWILRELTGDELAKLYQARIFSPLGLRETYLYTDASDSRPSELRFKRDVLRVPQAMTSFGPDGGVVSTSAETVAFLKAFFGGRLFDASRLPEHYRWNRVMFPLEYGVGVMRFKLPRWLSPFRESPELIGHSGLSGAFGFYCPNHRLYLAGTVNQIADPGRSFRLMLRLLNGF